jgi:hypothetical protein
MSNIIQLLTELLDVAAQADKQRLFVWYPQFLSEYPDAGAVLQFCLQLPASEVWPYLMTRFPSLTLLTRLQILTPAQTAAIQTAILFVHENLQEMNHGIIKTT